MKNIDKIKNMTVDEMAEFLCRVNCPQFDLLIKDDCKLCVYKSKCVFDEEDLLPYIKWLESEAE